MRVLSVLGLALLGACGPMPRDAASTGVASTRQAIIGGRVTFGEPEVFFLDIQYPNGDGFLCSSTLIGPHTLLTAAHCVVDEGDTVPTITVSNASSLFVAPKATLVKAVAWYFNPDYDAAKIINDTGVLQLERAPFAPAKPINRAPLENVLGEPLRVVGYGNSILNGNTYGSKRSTITRFDGVTANAFTLGNGVHGFCNGDSGGPAFFTFPDGVERQIGITSNGSSAVCGTSSDTDMRVDRYTAFIDPYLDEFEGSCGADGRCRPGCTPADPDCACFEDGVCNSACATPALDPDCPSSCANDGVCSKTACATPDPDCAVLGASCGRDDQCGARKCITSPQHALAYCSQACDGSHACPSGFECASGVCQYPQLPVAALGDPCTLGHTWCGDDGTVCALYDTSPQPRCVTRCYENADCLSGESCSVTLKDAKEGVCTPRIALVHVTQETLPAASGCAATPGSAAVLLGGLVLLVGRRRRSA